MPIQVEHSAIVRPIDFFFSELRFQIEIGQLLDLLDPPVLLFENKFILTLTNKDDMLSFKCTVIIRIKHAICVQEPAAHEHVAQLASAIGVRVAEVVH